MKNEKEQNLEMISLSHRIRIIPHNEIWKDVKYILRDLQHDVEKIQNHTMHIHWAYDLATDIAKDMLNEKISISDIDENCNNLLTYTNRKNKTKFMNVNGEMAEQASRDAIVKYKTSKKTINNHQGGIPSFKNPNLPIKNKAFKIEKINDEYIMTARMLSKEYANELHKGIKYNYLVGGKKKEIVYSRNIDDIKMSFKLFMSPRDNRTKDILHKCMSGEYKQGSSKLFKDSKGDWYLILTYSFVPVKEKELNEDNIMGIDMGIVYPVYMAFNNNLNRYNIEGGEIDSFRKGVQSRRNELLRQGKYCGEGRRGHGVATRIKPIQKLQDRVEDFKKTTNHKYSKYVVEMAIKHNCGTIQMEDLSGIADGDKKSTFLGNWTYYDLQQKIVYKAEKVGIKVVKVKSNYTSQRCSKCGNIHKENRDAKKDQAKFECVVCGFETNADYNAAKNIATKDIEKIIEEQLKAQEKALKHAMKYSV